MWRKLSPAGLVLPRVPGEQYLPWEPLLPPSLLRRGLSFYGSGRNIERVAAKLLAGRPITALTLGGSVTRGSGASNISEAYPSKFFQFINATFPNRSAVVGGSAVAAAFLVLRPRPLHGPPPTLPLPAASTFCRIKASAPPIPPSTVPVPSRWCQR